MLELLDAGADVHDCDDMELTLFDTLLAYTAPPRMLSTVLISCFEVLRDAGYDTQAYLRAELGLVRDGWLEGTHGDAIWITRRIWRLMTQRSLNDATLIFTVKTELKPMESQPSPPGGWKDEYDMAEHIYPGETGETSILVGPLEDGFQEIRVYP
jgi:hypothetical protein